MVTNVSAEVIHLFIAALGTVTAILGAFTAHKAHQIHIIVKTNGKNHDD